MKEFNPLREKLAEKIRLFRTKVMSLVYQLVEKGYLPKKDAASLEHKIKTSGKKEEEVILEQKIVSEDILFNLKSEAVNVPLKKVSPEEVPLKVLELIPEEAVKYYHMIPLGRKTDGVLEIGMVYPEDLKAREALNFLSRQGKFNYKIFLICPTTFNNFLKQYKTLRREVKKALKELEIEIEAGKGEPLVKPSEFERIVEEAPITRVVAVILRHAAEGRASDVHIEPTREKLRVRFRLDGILHASLFLPLKIHPAVIARLKVLSNLKLDETRVPQDGRFSAKIGDRNIDFRVSTFPTSLGEKIALRVLDPGEGLKNLEKLGFNSRSLKVIKKALKKPYGMILATGPTGSGKSTTLYALLNSFNKEGVNIMTLEDPVEYNIEGVNQSQIKTEIGYTFATGLRHILRQDPDIIMVGEIRDQESADLAIHAALTGHIVLSTLHTSNAAGGIPRLIDLGISPFLIPTGLSLIIAQRLVRVLCPDCKKKVKPTPKIKNLILEGIKGLSLSDDFAVYQPKGCRKCKYKGYSGRIALFEVLEVTKQLSDIILKEPSEAKIFEEAKRQEMITMRQEGILKVLEGVTSVEEVLRATAKR
jgi:type IV pilus assembly protein PilB